MELSQRVPRGLKAPTFWGRDATGTVNGYVRTTATMPPSWDADEYEDRLKSDPRYITALNTVTDAPAIKLSAAAPASSKSPELAGDRYATVASTAFMARPASAAQRSPKQLEPVESSISLVTSIGKSPGLPDPYAKLPRPYSALLETAATMSSMGMPSPDRARAASGRRTTGVASYPPRLREAPPPSLLEQVLSKPSGSTVTFSSALVELDVRATVFRLSTAAASSAAAATSSAAAGSTAGPAPSKPPVKESAWQGLRARFDLMLPLLHRGALSRHSKVALRKIETMDARQLSSYLKRNKSEKGGGLFVDEECEIGHGHSELRVKRIKAEVAAMRETADYVSLAFEAEAMRSDLKRSPRRLHAASKFDDRHGVFTDTTRWQLATLDCLPRSTAATGGFRSGVHHVMRNRYVLDERLDLTQPPREAAARKRYHRYQKPWTLGESEWRPRLETGNSRDFFETPKGLKSMLMIDWEMARQHHQLAWIICKAHLGGDDGLRQTDWNTIEEAPWVNAVEKVFERHALIIYNAFDHYAMLGKKSVQDILHKSEIFQVSRNAFLAFIVDIEIEDRVLNIGQLEAMFAVVDAPDHHSTQSDKHNQTQNLSRHEWLQILVRVAMKKYCGMTKFGSHFGNVAEAVEQLCSYHLQPFLPPVCLLNPNDFRRTLCYNEGIDSVMKAARPTMHAAFKVYAAAAGRSNEGNMVDAGRMSLGEFLTFVHHVGLIELGMVTMHAAMQAFSWSRIRAAKNLSAAEEIRWRTLTYEDFIEAIIRLSSIIALPTLAEVEAAEAADAGEFMLALYRGAPDAYRQFVALRSRQWHQPLTQRIHRSFSHLLSLMRRVIQANHCNDCDVVLPDGPIRTAILQKFFNRRHLHSPTPAAGLSVLALPTNFACNAILIESAMASVEEGIFNALRSVLAFESLSDEQIRKLRQAMAVAKFADAEYVFEQGAAGDVFYLITSGEAEVLHYDPDDPRKQETLLNVIGVSACFGEMALLSDAPRNASIMAKGPLHVVYVSRDRFEETLGRSLADMRLTHTEQDALRREAAPNEELDSGLGAGSESTGAQ